MVKTASKNKIILDNYDLADNPLSMALGIMLRPPMKKPLLFSFSKPRKVSFHSFFCLPFDIVYLNSKGTVVNLIEEVEPFSILPAEDKIKWVVELPPGDIKRKRIKKGTYINIKNG